MIASHTLHIPRLANDSWPNKEVFLFIKRLKRVAKKKVNCDCTVITSIANSRHIFEPSTHLAPPAALHLPLLRAHRPRLSLLITSSNFACALFWNCLSEMKGRKKLSTKPFFILCGVRFSRIRMMQLLVLSSPDVAK
jgi:hypothetical protein